MLKRPDIVALSSVLLEHVSLLKLKKTTYHKAMKVARNKPSIVRKLTSNETESHNVPQKKLKRNLWKHGKKDYRPKYGYLRFLFLELPFQSTILFSQLYELLPDINTN